MHAKGMTDEMIGVALASGSEFTISPKFWAEHLGLPYHQAAIRQNEMPRAGQGPGGLCRQQRRPQLSALWLRRSADRGPALRDPAPGLARHPADAAVGGSGLRGRLWPGDEFLRQPGRRDLRAAFVQGPGGLRPAGGAARATPTPRWCPPGATTRSFSSPIGSGAACSTIRRPTPRAGGASSARTTARPPPSAEVVLRHASRILPLLTTAHLPSASNNTFWPEVYTNMPIADTAGRDPYTDTPSPKRFGTVSPLDPQLFSRIEDYASRPPAGPRRREVLPGRGRPMAGGPLAFHLRASGRSRKGGGRWERPGFSAPLGRCADPGRPGAVSSARSCGRACCSPCMSAPAIRRPRRRPCACTAQPGMPGPASWRSPPGSTSATSPTATARSSAATGPTGWRRSTAIWPRSRRMRPRRRRPGRPGRRTSPVSSAMPPAIPSGRP